MVTGIRNIRKEKNIATKELFDLKVLDKEKFSERWDVMIEKLGHLKGIERVSSSVDGALSFRVKSNEYFIPGGETIDLEAEIQKLKDELNYTRGFLQSVQKKLANERFVANAPEQVVALEKKKAEDAKAKIETLEKSLANLE